MSNLEIEKELESLLELDISLLYKVVGSSITQELLHHPPGGEEEEGKNWFSRNIDLFKSKVCNNDTVRNLLQSDEYSKIALGSAIMDALGFAVFQGVPVTQISALVIKIGFDKFCK